MLQRISLIVIINLFLVISVRASHEKGSSRLDLKNYSGVNNSIFLQDDKINTVNAFVNFATPMGFFDYSYKNRLILGIDKSVTTIGSASTSLLPTNKDYSAEVFVTLSYNQLVGNSFVNVNVPCTLKVNYRGEIIALNSVNNGVKETDLDVFAFTGGYQAVAMITSVVIKDGANTIVSPGVLPENLYLELQCDAERYYDMATNAVPFNNNNQLFIRYYSDVTTGNQIELNWARIPGAEEYDVEWVWVDEYTYAYLDPNNVAFPANTLWDTYPELSFKNNSTRVRTDKNFYKISNTFEGGYVFFRIRGVGKTLTPFALTGIGNDPLMDYFTPWTWDDITNLPQLVSSFSPLSTINSIGAPVISGIQVGGGINGVGGTTVPRFISLLDFPGAVMNMEGNKNWVYKATYAEEGKKKEVVSYFDGSQRKRQTVTINNSANTAVVGESYYDFLGRASLQALPTPVEDATIKFYQTTVNGKNGFNFENVIVNPRPITKEVFGLGAAPGLCSNVFGLAGFSNLYGTGLYYSTNNPFINTIEKLETSYAPDAGNFPFSQTEFIADNTSKVVRQSGVGETFKIHSQLLADKHDTRYMYGVPLQDELDRLFGSESGYANRYHKNVTIDGNGQISVSYLNEDGKVIATALTGTAPANMNPLTNSNGINLTTGSGAVNVDLLNKLNAGDVDTPKDNNQLTGDALIFNQKLMVTSAQTYSFDYQLTGPSFSSCSTSGICFDCVYDLTFDITDKCGARPVGLLAPITLTLGKIVTMVNSFQADSVCGDDLVNFSFQQIMAPGTSSLLVNLDVGEYTVSKKLTVNKEALESYLEIYLRNCPLKLSDFQAAENANVDLSGCNMTCESCVTQLGTLSNYINTNAAIPNNPTFAETTTLTAQFNALVAECREPCRYTSYCDAAFETMLVDMSPGGQYADFEGPNNTFDPSQYPLSIYNYANSLSKKVSPGGAAPTWTSPSLYTNGNTEYYEEDNVTVSLVQVTEITPGVYQPPVQPGVTPVLVAGNLYTVKAKELLNGNDFITAWKPSWARSLVQYHPEYCYFEWCRQNSSVNGTPISVVPLKLDNNGDVIVPNVALPAITINTSDDYDSLLVTVDDITHLDAGSQSIVVDAIANDPYWTSTGFYYAATAGGVAPYNLFPSPAITGPPLNTIAQRPVVYYTPSPADFAFTQLHYPDKINYKTANNRFWDFKGSGLSIYQYAAIISTTLVAQLGQPVPSLLASLAASPIYAAPPSFGNTYILNLAEGTQIEKEQKRKAWQTFVTLYLGLKQELQQEAAESFVMNSGCRGCNDCIGKANFDPESVPFTTYSSMNMGPNVPFGFPNVNQALMFLQYLQNWYFPIFPNNQPQQCGNGTADLYKGKIKRFQSAGDAKNLDNGNGGNVMGNIYNATGLCPNAFYLQNFLNGMVDPTSGNSLLAATDLSAQVPEFNSELYKEVTGGVVPGVFTPALYNVTVSGLNLTANITISPFAPCSLNLSFPSPAVPVGINSWTNYPTSYTITNFTNLQATGPTNFNVVAHIQTTGAPPVNQYTLLLTGSTCFSITGCSFPAPCKLNGNGKSLKTLLSSLVGNGQFATGVGNNVIIGGPNNTDGSPHNAVFTNGLKPFLEIGTPGVNTWSWTQVSSAPYVYDITDGSAGPGANNKIRVSLTSITPIGFNLNCINSFQNFQIDPAVNGGFIMEGSVNYSPAVIGCPNGTVEIKGTAEIGTNLMALQPFILGECNFDLANCSSAEHQVTKDMKAFVMDAAGASFTTMLSAGSQSITNNPLFTALMRSYISSSININGSPNMGVPQNYYYWVQQSITSTEVNGWFIQTNNPVAPTPPLPANACKLNFKFKDPTNPGPLYPLTLQSTFSLVTSPLINNSAYKFYVLNAGGDTLIGETSCLPMRHCESCTVVTQVPPPGGTVTYTLQKFDCSTTYSLNWITNTGVSSYSPQFTPNCTTLNSFSLNPNNYTEYTNGPVASTIDFLYPDIYTPGLAPGNNPQSTYSAAASSYSQETTVVTGSNVLVFNAIDVNNSGTIPYNFAYKIDDASVYEQNFNVPQSGNYNINFAIRGFTVTANTAVFLGTTPTSTDYNVDVYIDNTLVYSNTGALGSINAISTNPLFLNAAPVHNLKIKVTKNNAFHFGNELYQITTNRIIGEPTYVPCANTTWPQDTMPTVEYEEPCAPYLQDIADNTAEVKYEQYLDSMKAVFIRNYTKHCMSNAVEKLLMKYYDNQYHYTLYYYDEAGNLVRTVPPEGVKVITNPADLALIKTERDQYGIIPKTVFTDHKLYTTYTYNSLNQLEKQQTPDAGISLFYYDNLGRLVVSQNAQQAAQSTAGGTSYYSYTRYEPLGRIAEVGQIKTTDILTLGGGLAAALSNPNFPVSISGIGTIRSEVTSTYYGDDENFVAITAPANFSNGFQQNLRTRVASVTLEDTYDGNNFTFNHATHYTYDVHGNVKELIQDNPALSGSFAAHRYKRTQYLYDLISGKVNTVTYQNGQKDMLAHEYLYDAENRITNVYTSRNGYTWDQDAKYYYYLHGPLARTEIGEHKVQGMDYAYTLQGWIKGVNSNLLAADNDMGKDGVYGLNNPNTNNFIHTFNARDAFGYNLNYYATNLIEDYQPVNSTIYASPGSYFLAKLPALTGAYPQLFNGNISSMGTGYLNIDVSIGPIPNTPVTIGRYENYSQLKLFTYDQLNRINDAKAISNNINGSNNWDLVTSNPDQYRETFTYDQNGNIMTAVRNNVTASAIDNLQYYYYDQAGGTYIPNTSSPNNATNKLAYVTDAVGAPVGNDIGNQTGNNYTYDAIGNLISDAAEQIAQINWTVYGKIKSIIRSGGSPKKNIDFAYDAQGNRISKRLWTSTGGGVTDYQTTYYVRDAQGNVLATYEKDYQTSSPAITLKLQELNLYGSSRLGNIGVDELLTTTATGSVIPNVPVQKRELGDKNYELSNHLGNVIAVVSDRKIPIDLAGSLTPADGTIDFFESDILQTKDYYAFGASMPGRDYQVSNYRYGMNGKEKDDEISGSGNNYDFGDRIYEARLGRLLSVDPFSHKAPFASPYSFADNNPIWKMDNNGDSTVYYTESGQFLFLSNDGLSNSVVIVKKADQIKWDIWKKQGDKSGLSHRDSWNQELRKFGLTYNTGSIKKFYNQFKNTRFVNPAGEKTKWTAEHGAHLFNKGGQMNIGDEVIAGDPENTPWRQMKGDLNDADGAIHTHPGEGGQSYYYPNGGTVDVGPSPEDRTFQQQKDPTNIHIVVSKSAIFFYGGNLKKDIVIPFNTINPAGKGGSEAPAGGGTGGSNGNGSGGSSSGKSKPMF